ncbi:hypothetical protein LEP1GSC043_2664, partial [Leptospira weilii str. Ecochallenge]
MFEKFQLTGVLINEVIKNLSWRLSKWQYFPFRDAEETQCFASIHNVTHKYLDPK